MGYRNFTPCSLSVQAYPRGVGSDEHKKSVFQAEGVLGRYERTKRSSRFCHLGDALVPSLAIEATDCQTGPDQRHFRARCLVCRHSCIFAIRDHSLTLCSETAFSIIRLIELTSLDVSDVTWNYLPPIVWSTVEICVGMVCACLPVMAPLLPILLRGRSAMKEPYVSSSFGRSNTTRGTPDFAKQNFDRLENDTTDFGLGRHPMNIRQTTDIDVHEEDSIVLHTLA